jgi:hypothetical protein
MQFFDEVLMSRLTDDRSASFVAGRSAQPASYAFWWEKVSDK